jgi:hypothetical protein
MSGRKLKIHTHISASTVGADGKLHREETFLIEHFDGECWSSTGHAAIGKAKARALLAQLQQGSGHKLRMVKI